MRLSGVFNIDQDIIKIYNDKDILFFSWYLINISLKSSQDIEKAKKHNLIFKMAIANSENYFSFITLMNPYHMIGVYMI